MKLLENNSNKIVLIKEGLLNFLELNVVVNDFFDEKNNYKAVINRNIGSNDTFQYLGNGSTETSFDVLFKTEDEYYELFNFIKNGEQCILMCNFLPLIPINILEFGEIKKYLNFFGYVRITVTDALNPSLDINGLYQSYLNYLDIEKATNPDKKSLLDKLKKIGENISKFVGNVNEKIGKFTSVIDEYSNAINDICQGIASSKSIITNPLNSVKNSVDVVLGGVSSVFNALKGIKNTVINTPNDLNNILDRMLSFGSDFKDLFKSGNKKADLEYSNNFIQDISNGILAQDFNKDIIGDSYNAEDLRNSNDFFKTCLLTNLLIGIYENTNEMQSSNIVDLQKMKTNTEKIYNYIINRNFITNDFKIQLDLFRIAFFKKYNYLYDNTQKIVEIEVFIPTSIMVIVYRVNGNLDYLEDTIKLNNIYNTGNVIGKIKVISNA